MNLVPAIGVYAALERARGASLSFPGGPPAVHEAVDARLLARALAWAADEPAAHGQIFNITNGDVYCWRDVWPAIAAVFGMQVGEPRVQRLADTMPGRADEWAALVDRYRLRSPCEMGAFVGGSWAYADILFGSPRAWPGGSGAAQHGEDPSSRLRGLHRHRGHAPRVARSASRNGNCSHLLGVEDHARVSSGPGDRGRRAHEHLRQ